MTVNDVIEKNIDNFNGWSITLETCYQFGSISDTYDLEDFYMSNSIDLDFISERFYISFKTKHILIQVIR